MYTQPIDTCNNVMTARGKGAVGWVGAGKVREMGTPVINNENKEKIDRLSFIFKVSCYMSAIITIILYYKNSLKLSHR